MGEYNIVYALLTNPEGEEGGFLCSRPSSLLPNTYLRFRISLFQLQMFIKLHYIKRQLAKKKQCEQNEVPSTTKDEAVFSGMDNDDIDEDGTLFEEAIRQLDALKSSMVATLVKHIAADFKLKSDSYKKER